MQENVGDARVGKEDAELRSFADHTIVYVENQRELQED